jgi:hypothetical protein
MARSGKIGIDYFSHDVDIMQDPKIKVIKAKHGLLGYAVYIRLLEELYREKGYYLQISEDFNILFCDDNNLDYDVYILILNECIEKGLFDEKLHNKYSILTSWRIQKNYCDATQRRKEVFFFKEYMLIKPSDEFSEKVNVYISTLNADICTQRKGKEIESKKKGNNYSVEFEQFWSVYPKKSAKITAYKAFKNAKDKPDIERLVRIIKANKVSRKWKDGFIPNPATWLNGGCWDDELQTEIPTDSDFEMLGPRK